VWLGSSFWSSEWRHIHVSNRHRLGNQLAPTPEQLPVVKSDHDHNHNPPHIAVIGAGFGGWGAANALLKAGCRVTLLDAGDDPTGEKGCFTPSGKPFDAGTKGFWMDYPNLYGLIENELNLGLDDVFSPCTNSSFYSTFGLEATAPVFGDSQILPSPLGQIVASAALFERLPFSDRASVAGLLLAILDLTPSSMKAYDKITAAELFNRFGLSKRLVHDFLAPTLLVGLFKPPEELSAAVVMELLYFYALAHQTSFDVRWLKKGSVSSSIFLPLHQKLSNQYPDRYHVLPASAVTEIVLEDGCVRKLQYKSLTATTTTTITTITNNNTNNNTYKSGEGILDVSGVILAVGAKGLASILRGSPGLSAAAPQLAKASTISSIDCIATRLWLDRQVNTRSPANVFANFPALRGAGGTFFMLDQLQPDANFLWGGESGGGSVVACDFYNSGALMSLSDGDIVEMLLAMLPSAEPAFKGVKVLDSHVVRYPGAVNCFAPHTFDKRPRTIVDGVKGLAIAGDFVWMGDDEPKSKGLCQERAYVSGLVAAAAITKGLAGATSVPPPIPVRPDEPQVEIGRQLSRFITTTLLGLPAIGNLFSKLLWPR